MNQYNVAQLQPPSLKAMIPIGADINSYRDYIYSGGGLYNHFNFIPHVVCGEWQGVDWIGIAMENPFDDPAIYGPEGTICISPDMSKVTVPFMSGMGLEGTIHTRGSSEAYIQAASKHKKLIMISEPAGPVTIGRTRAIGPYPARFIPGTISMPLPPFGKGTAGGMIS